MSAMSTSPISSAARGQRLFGLVGALLYALVFAAVSQAGSFWVWSCGQYGNAVWGPSTTSSGMSTSSQCPGTGLEATAVDGARVGAGGYARWSANAPPGLSISQINVPSPDLTVFNVNQRDAPGYGGGWFWAGGGAGVSHDSCGAGCGYTSPSLNSPYVGFQVICGLSVCTNGLATIQVGSVGLLVRENSIPSVIANGSDNLWYHDGWVRGTWPLTFSASDVSGICGERALVDGQSLEGPSAAPNVSVWQQCPQLTDGVSVNTAQYPNGAMGLILSARNAAGVVSSPAETVYVDNQTPTVAVSGPKDAPSTAGIQYVSASGSAGPSGVAAINCSVDGARAVSYPGASARVPVSGLGQHSVTCVAVNHAVNVDGIPGTSSPVTWTLSIRQPTADAISFGSRTLDALRCPRVTERIRVRGRLVTVRRHHRRVKIRRRGHVRRIRVRRCHPRVVRIRIRIHGRVHIEHVVVLPHTIQLSTIRVRHGASATVSGWVGTTTGVALAGQPVSIITAPDNGLNAFTQAAAVTSGADGTWSAKLPPGPSRIVQAIYGGASTNEPSSSGQIHLIVPAKVKLISARPNRVQWGGTVRITGRLEGGYLPAGGALVRLRIGLGSTFTTYGVHEHVGGDGRFTTSYTFGAGDPSVHRSFWFQIASLPMGDYPYAPAASQRRYVVVGGHPRGRRRPSPKRGKR